MTGIINYGMGNVGSILNMLNRIGVPSCLVDNPMAIDRMDRLILPGVGAFDAGMNKLQSLGLIPVLEEMVLARKMPILGICLGMQLLARRSEEGRMPGLGWLNAEVVRFKGNFDNNSPKLSIPHMGWREVTCLNDSKLLDAVPEPRRFYFVHSYHMVCEDPVDVIGTINYGGCITAAVSRSNIYGTQFHPEKSHKFGMQLLRNFSQYHAR